MRTRVALLLVLVGMLCINRAEAHFLFIRILPPAEGGRAAEVYFSELAEAGDPRFIDKVASTQLWLQRTPGKFEPLSSHKSTDRLRAWVPTSGSLLVIGRCDYGVLARGKQPPFLLRHFPKAIAGNPEELNRLPAHGKLPLEITAVLESDRIHLTALRDGKPLPRAEFVTVDAALNNVKLTADESGKASWKPPTPGVYSIYTSDKRKEAGEAGGKKYEEIRDFATIAFTWPLERKDADPAAVALFEEALAARAHWEKFPGFSARIDGSLDGRRFTGSISIDAKGEVVFTDDDLSRQESVSDWVQAQLESIVLHRKESRADPDRPRPVLRFGETRDDHPLGRLLMIDGGRFASSYRIKDKQIMVVNRILGKENMSITVLENERTPEGRYLPRNYMVQYWDAASGRLLRTETFQQRWQRIGNWDLPAQHALMTTGDAGVSIKRFTLSKHEMLKPR